MPPICGLPFKVNLNYFHSDLNYLFTEHFASNFFIRLSEIEQAYNEVFQIEYKDVLSMLNLEPNYIFEFVQKVYPNVFMGVPKPAEIPGFIKKGIMDMKYQPNLFFNQHAIEDGWATPTSQHRRTPAPIIEEVESDSSQYARGETSSSREYYNKIEYDMHVDNSSDVTNTQEIKEPTISFQPKKASPSPQHQTPTTCTRIASPPGIGESSSTPTKSTNDELLVTSPPKVAPPPGFCIPSLQSIPPSIIRAPPGFPDEATCISQIEEIQQLISPPPDLKKNEDNTIYEETPSFATTSSLPPLFEESPETKEGLVEAEKLETVQEASVEGVESETANGPKEVEQQQLAETDGFFEEELIEQAEELETIQEISPEGGESETANFQKENVQQQLAETDDFDEFFDPEYLALNVQEEEENELVSDELNQEAEDAATTEPNVENEADYSDKTYLDQILTAEEILEPESEAPLLPHTYIELEVENDASINVSEVDTTNVDEQHDLEMDNVDFFSPDFIAQLNAMQATLDDQQQPSLESTPVLSTECLTTQQQELEEGEIVDSDQETALPLEELTAVSRNRSGINYEELNEYSEFIDQSFLEETILRNELVGEEEEFTEADGADEFFDPIFLNGRIQRMNLENELEEGEILDNDVGQVRSSVRTSSSRIQEVDPMNRPKIQYAVQDGRITNYETINPVHLAIAEHIVLPAENTSIQREVLEKSIDNCCAILRLIQKAHMCHPVITPENWFLIEEEFCQHDYYFPSYSMNVSGVHDLIRLNLLQEKTGPSGAKHFLVNREVIFMRFFPLSRNIASNLYRMLKEMRKPVAIGSIMNFYEHMSGVVNEHQSKEEKIVEIINEFPEIFLLDSLDQDHDVKAAMIYLNERVPERDVCLDFSRKSL